MSTFVPQTLTWYAEHDVRRVGVPQPDDGLGESRDGARQTRQRGDARFRHLRRTVAALSPDGSLLHVAPEVRLDVQDDALRRKRAGLLEEQLESL